MSKNNTESVNFEKALKQLEKTVEALEKGDLSLEDSLKQFEQGIKLTRQCQQSLTEAEQKVQILVGDNAEDNLENYEEE